MLRNITLVNSRRVCPSHQNIANFILFSLISSCLYSCGNHNNDSPSTPAHPPYNQDSFNSYWYTGKAEVASYDLQQSRYGEIHDGKAELIFVTEPFSASKQVKLDKPETAGDDKITVMKLNFVKKFNTGIYPYSMMLSAFTPVEQQRLHTLKVSMSVQEWCGHVYTQMNLDNNHYEVKSFSYFEKEGDRTSQLNAALLEDEIWSRIRLNYHALPTGDINVIPGLFYTRLMHRDLEEVTASARLEKKDQRATYTLIYPERTLAITFSTVFPFTIFGWEETYKGLGGKLLRTSGRLVRKLHIDYWTKNKKADAHWRDSLRLTE